MPPTPTATAPTASAFPWPGTRLDPATAAKSFPNPEIIESRKLVAFDALRNVNKFYNVYLERSLRTATTGTGKTYPVFRVRVEFGRVGQRGQEMVFVPASTRKLAEEVYRAKIAEKTTAGRVKRDANGMTVPGDVYSDAGPMLTGTGATIAPVTGAGKAAQVAVIPSQGPGTAVVPASAQITVVPAAQAAKHLAPSSWDPASKAFFDTLLKEAKRDIAASMQVSKVSNSGLVTPLGVVDDGRLEEALKVIDQIEVAVKGNDIRQVILLNQRFFKLIPTATGQQVIDALLTNAVEINRERTVLQQARTVIQAHTGVNTTPVTLSPVTPAELDDLKGLLRANPCSCHANDMRGLTPTAAFRVTRPVERAALKQLIATNPAYRSKFMDAAGKLTNIPLYLHGSARGNAAGILTRGLLPNNVSGYYTAGQSYGNGIYFANNAGKSLNYTHAARGQRVIFVAFVALANPYVFKGFNYGGFNPPSSADGVHAIGDGTLRHDEWVAHRSEQVALAYVMTV